MIEIVRWSVSSTSLTSASDFRSSVVFFSLTAFAAASSESDDAISQAREEMSELALSALAALSGIAACEDATVAEKVAAGGRSSTASRPCSEVQPRSVVRQTALRMLFHCPRKSINHHVQLRAGLKSTGSSSLILPLNERGSGEEGTESS